MKSKRFVFSGTLAVVTVLLTFIVITAFASASDAQAPPLQTEGALKRVMGVQATQAVSITFPPGDWPWYAQGEITVRPEPPLPNQPVQICAEVVNMDAAQPHTATLEFSIANFGIGVPFTPVGVVDVEVPPNGTAQGCVVWVPPNVGHWCIQVLLDQPGALEPQRSQRNIDVWEPLVPGGNHTLTFQVGPFDTEGRITFTHSIPPAGWDVAITPNDFFLEVNTRQTVSLTTSVPQDIALGTFEPIVDVEGFLNGETIGGFRKMDNPPVILHQADEPVFAESEISINPYPPRANEPVEICVEVYNLSDETQTVEVQFSWANFGIGVPFTAINGPIVVEIPPNSHKTVCINWVPRSAGHFCVQAELFILGDVPYEPQFSQRNMDVAEPLEPGVPHVSHFPVGNTPHPYLNPTPSSTDVWLETDIQLPGWEVTIDPNVLTGMEIGEIRMVTMTVTPPADEPMPPDGTPIVDVRAFVDGAAGARLIGGIRKVYRPPVPLHPYPDPVYAEREISVHPYPPLAGQPTQVCVELYNPTNITQTVTVNFAWANFGIGIPFTPINGPRTVEIPPNSTVNECIVWVPYTSGHVCLQVTLEMDAHEPQRSQRNIDVDEPLQPGEGHTLVFPVGNPFEHTVNIELGAIPHLPDWQVELTPSTLVDVEPGGQRAVSLTVTPPAGVPLPSDGELVVDIEAYAPNEAGEMVLIGGFRKIHRPPVPLHPTADPPYAEREITIEPYPARPGEPVEICVELYNPTPWPQDVEVQFSWANFGIGIPFTPIDGLISVHLEPYSHVKQCINWVPPSSGHFCLQVELLIPGYEVQRSQRNIDIDEPLEPGVPHTRPFLVGNPTEEVMNITLGLIPHVEGWEFSLSENELPDMEPGARRVVSLTVIPPADRPLPDDNTVVVDVEAYGDNGELIGGFRKVHRPPVPLHPTPDPPYAEREIKVYPYPPLAGEPTQICVELRNPTNLPQDVWVQFSWANFGVGLSFTPIDGLIPVHLPPNSVVNECIHWVPPVSGHLCLQVELFIPNYERQRSQRNIDVDEPLQPGETDTLVFPVGNPFNHPATITLGLVPHLPGWEFTLSEDVLPDVPAGAHRAISLTVTPPVGEPIPENDTPIVDIEAYVDGVLIGGFRKIHRPPVPLHPYPDPPYAEREISVSPYPPRAGEPVEICVELRNPTPWAQDVEVQFAWANFGIGIPFTPINGHIPVHLEPFSTATQCIHWVPPNPGHFCIQVELFIEDHETQRSQRNIDVDEPLRPLTAHSATFPVGNPFDHPVTITLGLLPHLPEWDIMLSTDILPDMQPGEIREVVLMVTPPEELPEDGHAVVDVEAYAEGRLIGGFRKVFRPDVPIHEPQDPVYAEREIFIHPYPPREREPTEVGAEIRNPTGEPQTITVTFAAANFGIGLPFELIHDPLVLEVPANGVIRPSVMWIPPHGGLWCIEVKIWLPGHGAPFWSRRNIDVGEPLEPLVPHARTFPVRNPLNIPVTITLGLVPHLPDWGLELSEDVLVDVQPGEIRHVTLTVTPPEDLPEDGAPIVDVEAFVAGRLIGGFRKLFRPPVPVHQPQDPVYAESEIGVDPYPVVPGDPVKLSVEVFNPTDTDRVVTATFRIARFGIGLPFSAANITPNPVRIFVPAHGAARGHVIWNAPNWIGKFCVEVMIEVPGHEPVWSRRNVDVGEPLEPGQPHSLVFPVGSWPHTEPVTVDLGLIPHLDGWDISLSERTVNVDPGEIVSVTLTVTPPLDVELGTGRPIVDVEGFVNGELLGGFRKLDRPPVPIHKPHEKNYAETELRIEPDPPVQGHETRVSSVVQNTSDVTTSVTLIFGWAKFGIGIPFTTTGMVPTTRTVTLSPHISRTAWVSWTPTMTGTHCVQVRVVDPDGTYEDQISQRNVRVAEEPPCGFVREFSFTIYNDSPFTATVDLGLITFNVPEYWIVTTVPSGTLDIGAFDSAEVIVHVEIPCVSRQSLSRQDIQQLQQGSGSLPTINVEAYTDGDLVGGIEIQLTPGAVAAPGVELSPGGAQTALPGSNAHYSHVITNTGTATDTFVITHASSQGWDVSMSANYMGQTVMLPIQIGAGMTATLMATVTVPSGATVGTVNTTMITATSQTTPAIFATAYDITTVGGGGEFGIYLPLVLRTN